MYGIPPGTDLSFLVGSELLQVCIGENEVILNSHPDTSFMIATDVRIFDDVPVLLRDPKSIGLALLSFLGSSILLAEGSTDGTLKLVWSNGQAFEILDTSAEFESYTITHGDQILVV